MDFSPSGMKLQNQLLQRSIVNVEQWVIYNSVKFLKVEMYFVLHKLRPGSNLIIKTRPANPRERPTEVFDISGSFDLRGSLIAKFILFDWFLFPNGIECGSA